MVRKIICCVLFIISIFVGDVLSQTCTTPKSLPGTCLNIRECPELLNLLRMNVTDEVKLFLRSSRCTTSNPRELLLCCPTEEVEIYDKFGTCSTPKGETGTCIELKQCTEFVDLLMQNSPNIPENITTYLQRAKCDPSDMRSSVVCCPSQTTEATTRRYESTTRRFTTTFSPPRSSSRPIVDYGSDISSHPNMRYLPSTSECGYYPQSRSILDKNTKIDDYPWNVLISYRTRDSQSFRCGGSLISKRYVLTAAHCLTHLETDARIENVRLGEHDLTTTEDCEEKDGKRTCSPPVQDIPIEEMIAHPDYDKTQIHNDIGIIRLSRDADINQLTVKPVCLPIGEERTLDLTSQLTVVAGWGQMANGKPSQKLQYSLRVISNDACGAVYNRSVPIIRDQMCTESTKHLGSCSADGGDPLIYSIRNSYNNRYYQFGVVSFGPTVCGMEDRPEVFTRVVPYLPWILSNLRA